MNFVEVTNEGAADASMLTAEGGTIKIPLPPRFRESVGVTTGRKLAAGFRPEHIEIGEPKDSHAATFRANADVVEYLGNEELLHVNSGGRDIVAIVNTSIGSSRATSSTSTSRSTSSMSSMARVGHRSRPARRWPRRRDRVDRVKEPGPGTAEAQGVSAGPNPTALEERVVDSRILHHGRYLDLRIDTIERADGSRATREIVGHPGAVAVVAIDADDRVLLVRQFRVAVGRTLLEIPAGTLDVDAATGEVESPDSPRPGSFWRRPATAPASGSISAASGPHPGFASELMHLYLATDLYPADADRLGPDEDERLELVTMPAPQAIDAAERGEIADETPFLMRRVLAEDGYAIDIAHSGEDARLLAFVNQYDGIVLDLELGDRHGFEILQELRSAGKTTPFCFTRALRIRPQLCAVSTPALMGTS